MPQEYDHNPAENYIMILSDHNSIRIDINLPNCVNKEIEEKTI